MEMQNCQYQPFSNVDLCLNFSLDVNEIEWLLHRQHSMSSLKYQTCLISHQALLEQLGFCLRTLCEMGRSGPFLGPVQAAMVTPPLNLMRGKSGQKSLRFSCNVWWLLGRVAKDVCFHMMQKRPITFCNKHRQSTFPDIYVTGKELQNVKRLKYLSCLQSAAC